MSSRTVRVILEAVTGGFESAMSRAAASAKSAADQISSAGGKTGDILTSAKDATKEMGRELAKASQTNEWKTIGTQALVAGAAIGGVLVAVGKTGVEYNTLQQTSRAALKTMLGGTEEVNRQMGKLDDFARTSPFAKDVFIKSQQEMLAFGIETEKVVPYLDSINEAVAAAGGSSQTIAEISTIMSGISSAAKITGNDLDSFATRGINAAELIGSQLGVTGADIREQISDGALDAGIALDALAAGMKETFDGASANVKNTMAGAMDRVKAGWRDMSASFMEGAVDPTSGGGWLVNMTNGLADVLRIAEAIPQPLQEATLGIAGLSSASLLGLGGFMKLTTTLVEGREAVKVLSTDFPKLSGAIGGVGRVAGGAALAFGAMRIIGTIGEQLNESAMSADDMGASLESLAGSSASVQATGLDRFFRDSADPAKNLAAGVYDMSSAFEQIEKRSTSGLGFFLAFDDLVKTTFGVTSNVKKVDEAVANLDVSLAQMDGRDSGQFFKKIAEDAEEAGRSTEDWIEEFPVSVEKVTRALEEASDENFTYATNAENLAAVLQGNLPDGLLFTEQGIKSVTAAMEEGLTAIDMTGKELMEYDGKMIAITESQREFAAETAKSAASFGDFLGAYGDATMEDTPFNSAAFTASLDEQIDSLVGWETDVLSLSGRVSSGFLEHLTSMGVDGAGLVKELSNMSVDELAKVDAQYSLIADGASDFGITLATSREELNTSGAAMVNLAQKMGAAGIEVDAINGFLSTARNEFVQAAIDMDYTAQEANALADAAGLIPNSIVTEFTAEGVELSTTQINDLNKQLEEIPPEKRADVVTIAHTEGAAAAQVAIDEIKDENKKKVTVDFDPAGIFDAESQLDRVSSIPHEARIVSEFDSTGVFQAESQMGSIPDVEPWVNSMYNNYGETQARSNMSSIPDVEPWVRSQYDGSETSRAKSDIASVKDKTVMITAFYRSVGAVGAGVSFGGSTGGYGADIFSRPIQRLAAGGQASSFPLGGLLSGPGTSTSDSIPAWLSTKEYVVKAASVDKIGVHRLDYLNETGTIPHFDIGGSPARAVNGNLAQGTLSHTAGPSVTNIYVEGREALELLVDMTRDGVRNEYQMNGVHRG